MNHEQIDEVIAYVMSWYGFRYDDFFLRRRLGRLVLARQMALYVLNEYFGIPGMNLAEKISMSVNNINYNIRRMRDELRVNRARAKEYERIIAEYEIFKKKYQ